jgi:hypothetical protein
MIWGIAMVFSAVPAADAAESFSWAPQAFGRTPVASSRSINVGGAEIQVDFAAGSIDLPQEQVVKWIESSAKAVATYYGKYPVPRERILVVFVEGSRGVNGGTTWGDVGGFPAMTRIHVGQHTTQQDLDSDWMMTHEMVHTAFPSMADEHHWIEEGLATYVEPIARVQAGFLTPEKIWSDMVRDMPQGDPGTFDRGLDRTHSWGRTYWGGAQFCLLADVMIRKETHNRKGLQDALRGIVAAGGTIDKDWPISKAFEAGDHATGTHVLTDLYNQMRDTAKPVDLDALWKDLGIERASGGIHFDDKAPSAAIRQAITRSPQS